MRKKSLDTDVYAQSTVRGSFRYMDGEAVENLEITLTGGKTDAYLTKTDSLGDFSIRVPLGNYKFACRLFKAFTLYQRNIEVNSDTDLGLIEIDRELPMLEIDEVVVK